jgi:hypothetical protein
MRPHPKLVAHDICVRRERRATGRSLVVATVECERRGTLLIEVCEACERFERIEAHEAGYTMLCRSLDEELPERASLPPPDMNGEAPRDLDDTQQG